MYSSFLRRSVSPTLGTVAICIRKVSPHNYWLWKPVGLISRKARGLLEMETPLLWLCMREIHWLLLGSILKEQGFDTDWYQKEVTVSPPFLNSSSSLLAQGGQMLFLAWSIYLPSAACFTPIIFQQSTRPGPVLNHLVSHRATFSTCAHPAVSIFLSHCGLYSARPHGQDQP